MFKDLSMRIFLGHLAAYVAVTLICAGVNLWLTPDTLWFPWVLMGWGIAVATHALALLLRKTHRRERVFIDKCTRSFTVHLFAYVATVLLLFFVNLTVTPNAWWFYWVALGWGAGLIPHAWSAFFRRRPSAPREAPATKRVTKSETHPAQKQSPGKPRRKSPGSKQSS
ncbi:MAG: 2TM domain-containing protein [Methyloceanibacter sp.]